MLFILQYLPLIVLSVLPYLIEQCRFYFKKKGKLRHKLTFFMLCSILSSSFSKYFSRVSQIHSVFTEASQVAWQLTANSGAGLHGKPLGLIYVDLASQLLYFNDRLASQVPSCKKRNLISLLKFGLNIHPSKQNFDTSVWNTITSTHQQDD